MNIASRIRAIAALSCTALLAVLTACGGGGGGSVNGTRVNGTFAVGGTVTGLAANSAVTLVNNGGDAIAVTANGSFAFASGVASGGAYAVTVQSHTPGVACSVGNGNGAVGSAAITNVAVTCGAGALQILHAFDGSPSSVDGQSPSSTLVADSSGNLYGTTQGGGSGNCPGGCGTVFKISPDRSYSVIYNFTGGTGGANPYAGLVIDSAGNLYGTTYADGVISSPCAIPNTPSPGVTPAGCGTVFKVSSVTGNLLWTYSFDGSPSGGARPSGGLAMDSTGNMYGTTSGDGTSGYGTVFRVTQSGTVTPIYTFASVDIFDGTNPYGTLLIDAQGNLYGTTYGGGMNGAGTIFKMTSGGSRTWLYSLDRVAGDGQKPYGGLLMDSTGNMYGTTYSGGTNDDGTVFKITASGVHSVIHSFDSSAPLKEGKTPYGTLILDSLGNLYGTCSAGGANGSGTVFKITPSGVHSVLYSFGASATDGIDPRGALLMDSAGNIYGTTFNDGTNGVGNVFKID